MSQSHNWRYLLKHRLCYSFLINLSSFYFFFIIYFFNINNSYFDQSGLLLISLWYKKDFVLFLNVHFLDSQNISKIPFACALSVFVFHFKYYFWTDKTFPEWMQWVLIRHILCSRSYLQAPLPPSQFPQSMR